jgi:hypothetical protein
MRNRKPKSACGGGTYIVSDARDLVRPNLLLFQWMVRVALREKVLEEAHVLQTEERNLVVGLMRC